MKKEIILILILILILGFKMINTWKEIKKLELIFNAQEWQFQNCEIKNGTIINCK